MQGMDEEIVSTERTSLGDLKMVFMGTPEFAVASLDALIKAGGNIVAVITAPDKPAGRGMKLTESAVKKHAVRQGLRVLQPDKLKHPGFLQELQSLQPDLQIVVAFRMLPEAVWRLPPLGTVNLHGSLLPQYRGAAPINWAVINGEHETGVTTFRLKHEIDTGNILLQERFEIGEDETAGEVHDRMKEIGAALLVKTVKGIAEGTLSEIPQDKLAVAGTDVRSLKHAPKIFTETCKIDWTKPVSSIYNLIRGLSPHPGAFTTLDGKIMKIYKAEKIRGQPSQPSGGYETDKKTYLRFVAADGYINVKELQLEGKKKMKVDEFLRGWR
jgi:methionyl-tRNA formyltransferase